jgi:hypothetical protein
MELDKEQLFYWNFSKFRIGFELKIKDDLGFKIQ